MDFYHEGMRALQDRYDGRAVPDRLAANRMRQKFTDGDREFIETAPFFFLATATPESVDCSFKGGEPGFVQVVGENVLAWPDYDGNRMYRSLGNVMQNARVGLLFIRFDGTLLDGAARLRVNGRAEIDDLNVLVNNAAIVEDQLLISTSLEDWNKVMGVNLRGAFLACRRAIEEFMAGGEGGRIVNVSSIGANGSAGQASYAASKSALLSLTRSIAKEYGRRGISCNSVVPGLRQGGHLVISHLLDGGVVAVATLADDGAVLLGEDRRKEKEGEREPKYDEAAWWEQDRPLGR